MAVRYLSKAVNGNFESFCNDGISTQLCMLPTQIVPTMDKLTVKENVLSCLELVYDDMSAGKMNKQYTKLEKKIKIRKEQLHNETG